MVAIQIQAPSTTDITHTLCTLHNWHYAHSMHIAHLTLCTLYAHCTTDITHVHSMHIAQLTLCTLYAHCTSDIMHTLCTLHNWHYACALYALCTTDIMHTLSTLHNWHYELSPWGIKIRNRVLAYNKYTHTSSLPELFEKSYKSNWQRIQHFGSETGLASCTSFKQLYLELCHGTTNSFWLSRRWLPF